MRLAFGRVDQREQVTVAVEEGAVDPGLGDEVEQTEAEERR